MTVKNVSDFLHKPKSNLFNQSAKYHNNLKLSSAMTT